MKKKLMFSLQNAHILGGKVSVGKEVLMALLEP